MLTTTQWLQFLIDTKKKLVNVQSDQENKLEDNWFNMLTSLKKNNQFLNEQLEMLEKESLNNKDELKKDNESMKLSPMLNNPFIKAPVIQIEKPINATRCAQNNTASAILNPVLLSDDNEIRKSAEDNLSITENLGKKR